MIGSRLVFRMVGDQNLDPNDPPKKSRFLFVENLKFSGITTGCAGGATITSHQYMWRACGTGQEKTTGGGLNVDHSVVNDSVCRRAVCSHKVLKLVPGLIKNLRKSKQGLSDHHLVWSGVEEK